MKAMIAIAILLIIGVVQPRVDDARIFKAFQDFIKSHHKTYTSPNEYVAKYEVFKTNYHMINEANRLSLKKSLTYTMKVNQFADLTPEEFRHTYLNLNVDNLKALKSQSEIMTSTIEDVPESMDWRDIPGAVTGVKDQGSCGSCWAFSAIANIEGQYGIKTKKEQRFSEQQLVDCDVGNLGCDGGLMETAFAFLKETGVMKEDDYKYTGEMGMCLYDQSLIYAKITGFDFASEDEEEIRRLLAEKGPLSAALNASHLQFYSEGILDPLICSKKADHAVTIVGYGSEGKKKYWIIKNSWGQSWGEKGYFRLIAGKEKCGINSYVLSADVEAVNMFNN